MDSLILLTEIYSFFIGWFSTNLQPFFISEVCRGIIIIIIIIIIMIIIIIIIIIITTIILKIMVIK